MWSDDELDSAFRRLAPPASEPEPFPLDAWLRLEAKLDKDLLERQFRLRLWKFFAGEVAVVTLVGLAWLLWSSSQPLTGKPTDATLRLTARTTHAKKAPAALKKSSEAARSPATVLLHQDPAHAPADGSMLTAASPAAAQAARVSNRPQDTARAYALANLLLPQKDKKRHPAAAAILPAPAGTHRPKTSLAAASQAEMPARPIRAAMAGRHSRSRALLPSIAATPNNPPSRRKRTSEKRTTQPTSGPQPQALAFLPPVAGATPAAPHRYRARHRQEAGQPGALRTVHNREDRQQPVPARPFAANGTRAAGRATVATADNASANGSSSPAASLAIALAELPARPVALQTVPLAALPALLVGPPLPPPAPLPEPVRLPRLFVGLMAAPDVSTVKMADFQAPRANLGLLLEYRLTGRLRLHTGLLRGTKVYRARREDYNWAYYANASKVRFEWVDGSCTIFDVPLNLRYDLVQRPRYHLFATAGLSSLLMQREKYAYDYTYDSIPANPYYPNPNPVSKSGRWERAYVNQNQHWFSVLNLSLGYERKFGPHWSAQAEPYVKLPLGGVGAGKLRLASGGVFFGVKYGF